MLNRARKWIAAVAVLVACAGPAMGDPGTRADSATPSSSLSQWTSSAQARLGLQASQQRELRALVDGNAERLREMFEHRRADTDDSRLSMHEELDALRQDFRDGLERILTLEQLAEWDALIEELAGAVHLRNAPRLADSAH